MTTVAENLLDRITVTEGAMCRKPTIRGLRITVEQVLRALAGGLQPDDLLADYPELEPEDIKAALAYAANVVGEERLYPIPGA